MHQLVLYDNSVSGTVMDRIRETLHRDQVRGRTREFCTRARVEGAGPVPPPPPSPSGRFAPGPRLGGREEELLWRRPWVLCRSPLPPPSPHPSPLCSLPPPPPLSLSRALRPPQALREHEAYKERAVAEDVAASAPGALGEAALGLVYDLLDVCGLAPLFGALHHELGVEALEDLGDLVFDDLHATSLAPLDRAELVQCVCGSPAGAAADGLCGNHEL